jgi:small subunit ribosomal protein S35
MGDNHPAEKKVVVQFAPDDLGLTPVQADKLKKLAGPRFNPETELIKMSCESYAHPAQNKRYLSTLVDDLIAAAKDPKDTFADVPLDLRHHRIPPKPRFPKEWFMTEERKKELEEGRHQLRLAEVQAEENGQLVDGKKVIDSYLLRKAEELANQKKVEQLVPAGKRSSGSARAR